MVFRNTTVSSGSSTSTACFLLRELISRSKKITLNEEPQRGVSVFINELVSLPAVCE